MSSQSTKKPSDSSVICIGQSADGSFLWPTLLLDGKSSQGAYVKDSSKLSDSTLFAIYITNPEMANAITALRFCDLPTNVKTIEIYDPDHMLAIDGFHRVLFLERDESENPLLRISYLIDFVEWKHAWNPLEYVEELSATCEKQKILDLTLGRPEINDLVAGLGPSFIMHISANTVIDSEVVRLIDISTTLHESTERSLEAKFREGSIVVNFDFPMEVRVPCEQYLQYFAQFLHDLGVEADTSLAHEAGQMLFTVTPTDKEDALDKVRAALDLYLHLPASPVSDASHESIAVQRLESTILRLKSDLKLASAEMQAHTKTIEAQQLIMDIHKGLLTGEIMVSSMKNVIDQGAPQSKDQEREEFLSGTVALVPIRGKGVEIHLPEIFRRLKKLFSDKQ